MTSTSEKSIIGNAPEERQDDPETLRRQIAFFVHALACATVRKSRAEDLMQRRQAKAWDAAKKAKMVRRLTSANQELEQAAGALEQLREKLSQLVASGPSVNAVAPFIPSPTSV